MNQFRNNQSADQHNYQPTSLRLDEGTEAGIPIHEEGDSFGSENEKTDAIQ